MSDKPSVPVLLIPGITGTTLWYKDGTEYYNAWIPISTTSGAGAQTPLNRHFEELYGRFDPVTKTVVKVEEKGGPFPWKGVLIPAGILEYSKAGLFAISSLCYGAINPALIKASHYFKELIEFLESKGYVKDATLFGFPYDWRQSNQFHVPSLKEQIEYAMQKAGTTQVDIVTHSMGGLVTKVFLAKEHDFFRKHVRKWIALACPFRGSPALTAEALLTGIELGHNFIEKQYAPSRDHVFEAMVYYPSMVELTPQPFYKWNLGDPSVRIWKHLPNGEVVKEVFDPSDVQMVQQYILHKYEMNHDGVLYNWHADPNVWKQGRETQALLKKAKLPKGVRFYNMVGVNRMCPFGVTYGTQEDPLYKYQDLPAATRMNTFVDGDGTVPVESAMGHGFKTRGRSIVFDTHTQMLNNMELHAQVLSWLSE
jgi:phospholipase A1